MHGARRTDSDMIDSILSYNATHFAQARTNGASAAQQTPFADSLRSFRTPQKEVLQNMDDIINGKLDTSLIQDFEIPFYRAFHRVAPPRPKNWGAYLTFSCTTVLCFDAGEYSHGSYLGETHGYV